MLMNCRVQTINSGVAVKREENLIIGLNGLNKRGTCISNLVGGEVSEVLGGIRRAVERLAGWRWVALR